jgi:hypothetical protein
LFEYGISDVDCKSLLYLPQVGFGTSAAQVEAPKYDGAEFHIKGSYEVEVRKIDTLVTELNVIPNYIKIDVDGVEVKILHGAKETFGNPEVRGVLAEINHDHLIVDKYMTELGFTAFNRFNSMELNARIAQEEHNVVYVRG